MYFFLSIAYIGQYIKLSHNISYPFSVLCRISVKIHHMNPIYSQRATVDDALEHSWLKVMRNLLCSNNIP